jgi:hypothetical protein
MPLSGMQKAAPWQTGEEFGGVIFGNDTVS